MSKRRYIFTFSALESFWNITSTIEGDLESGIEEIKKNMRETLFKNSIETIPIALISALQLDTRLPPQFILLPIEIKRDIQQVLIDWDKGELVSKDCANELRAWLETTRRTP